MATSAVVATNNAPEIPLSYQSIAAGTNTGGLTWVAQKAPVTGDTVYTAQQGGNTLYVGPDNQLYTGGASAFYGAVGRAGANINPILTGGGRAIAQTWAALFPNTQTSNVVQESGYTGPGGDSQAQNDAAAQNLANLFAGAETVIGTNGAAIAPSSGATTISTNTGALPASPAGTDPGTSGSGDSSIVNPQTAADALIQAALQGANGINSAGTGSIANGAGVPEPISEPTTSSAPSPVALVALVIAGALIVFWLWKRGHKKAAGASAAGE